MTKKLDCPFGKVFAISIMVAMGVASIATVRAVGDVQIAGKASLVVHAAEKSQYPIPRYITGKFCEHLYFNVTNGMEAQILKNPTFSDYPFSTGQLSPDGIATFHYTRDEIARAIRNDAGRWGWPQSEVENLVKSRNEAVACWWAKLGPVEASPDTGPSGGRAQRIAVREAGQGICQWTWLPLHRVRKYDASIWVRSPDLRSMTLTLSGPDGDLCARATSLPVGTQWQRFDASIEVATDLPADKAYRFAMTADGPGQFVVDRVLLYPADHISRADPDVIRFLKESRLPILRWPGGNFVSGYHWQDGVGPIDRRPTLPNYAWGQQENNLFGTDEFLAFCRAVGCDPMICVNAGNGTPEEAAQWVEYCNGGPDTPMGRLRVANGNSKPFNVRHWEVGNELWGNWQYHWTTAEGYVDRYRRFVKAMLAADPTIEVYACGAPVLWGKKWNDTLIAGTSDILRATTDHPLIGGDVPTDTDPLDVFRDFMAVPEVLERRWAALRDDMKNGGVNDPQLAVTELQLFAHLGRSSSDAPRRLTHENLVNPATQAEALYDVLIYHSAVRLAPFVTMVTHSATVNHGGGLRKSRERVYANPCHWAQTMFAALAEAVPVKTDLTCSTEKAPLVLPELRNAEKEWTYKTLDVLAAQAADGSLLVSIVHKMAETSTDLEIAMSGFESGGKAEVQTLAAAVPWAANTLEAPEAIKPVASTKDLSNGRLSLRLPPYSFTLVRVPRSF
ncbi:MAG: alpha-L-arabinofuranosidase C-terminal domain-containing protein [Phycisphaerales bacterium]